MIVKADWHLKWQRYSWITLKVEGQHGESEESERASMSEGGPFPPTCLQVLFHVSTSERTHKIKNK